MSGLLGPVARREEGDLLSWDIGCKKVRLAEEEPDLGRAAAGEVQLHVQLSRLYPASRPIHIMPPAGLADI